jgi:hypothetical protein
MRLREGFTRTKGLPTVSRRLQSPRKLETRLSVGDAPDVASTSIQVSMGMSTETLCRAKYYAHRLPHLKYDPKLRIARKIAEQNADITFTQSMCPGRGRGIDARSGFGWSANLVPFPFP